jgi:hypothetical protein
MIHSVATVITFFDQKCRYPINDAICVGAPGSKWDTPAFNIKFRSQWTATYFVDIAVVWAQHINPVQPACIGSTSHEIAIVIICIHRKYKAPMAQVAVARAAISPSTA